MSTKTISNRHDHRALIYGLVDPVTGHLRYVGQSRRGLYRAFVHRNKSSLRHCTNKHKARWINQLLLLKKEPEVVVLQELSTPDLLDEAEIGWIAYFTTMGCPLTNLTSGGGSGWKPTLETREKQSRSAKLRKTPPHTAEHKARISAALMGHPVSAASRLTLCNVNKGRKLTDEHKNKIRNGLLKASIRRTVIVDQYGTIYSSMHEAARKLGLHPANVNAVVKGRLRHTAGYIFKLVNPTSR